MIKNIPRFNKLLSALFVVASLSTLQALAKNDPEEKFGKLLNATYNASEVAAKDAYFRTKTCISSQKGGKAEKQRRFNALNSSPGQSAIQKDQKNKARNRLFEQKAKEADKLIKKYKIDVNKLNKYVGKHGGEFPAPVAIKSDSIPMMEVLIKNGLNLDNCKAYGSDGECLIQSVDMAKLIVKHTKNPKLVYGATHIASMMGDLELLRFCHEQGQPFSGEGAGDYVSAAARNCTCQTPNCPHMETIKYLLKNGFNLKNDRGALVVACRKGNEDLVRLLLEHGADKYIHQTRFYFDGIHDPHPDNAPSNIADFATEYSGEAIVEAGIGGNINIFKMLLDKGANIHATRDKQPNGGNLNALHLAAKYNNAAIIPFLIEQGIDINTQATENGVTPLILAAHFGNLEATQALLAAGADHTIKDKAGKTATDYAIKTSKKATFDIRDNQEFCLGGANKTGAKQIARLLKQKK